jgi:TonB family protein
MAAGMIAPRLALGAGVAAIAVACATSSTPPMASIPARTSFHCYTPSPDDYAIVIVPRDTTFRDSAWLRPMLEGIGQNWPVELPLPRRQVDVRATILRDGGTTELAVDRRSGSGEFDVRALTAVAAALANEPRPLPDDFLHDSLPLLVRFGVKDMTGAYVQTWLSVAMPPKPRRTPDPDFPVERTRGQQVLVAFTVDSTGGVDTSSIEVISASDGEYARAVMAILPRWRFAPSTVRGCRVARRIRWEFGRPLG